MSQSLYEYYKPIKHNYRDTVLHQISARDLYRVLPGSRQSYGKPIIVEQTDLPEEERKKMQQILGDLLADQGPWKKDVRIEFGPSDQSKNGFVPEMRGSN